MALCLFITFAVLVCSSLADWQFELLLHNYSNPTSKSFFNSELTKCCDIPHIPSSSPCDEDPCDNTLTISLAPITCKSHQLSCTYGYYKTGVFEDSDYLVFNKTIKSADTGSPIDNPLVFTNKDSWPVNNVVVLVIAIDDFDSASSNDMVDLIYLTIPVTTSSQDDSNAYTPLETVTGYYNYSFLSFSYRMRCMEGFYGPTCSQEEDDVTPSPTSQLVPGACTNGFLPPLVSSIATAVGLQESQLIDSLCKNMSICIPAASNGSEPAEHPAARWELAVFMVISSILVVAVVICSVLVLLLVKKGRRKIIPIRVRQERELPVPPPAGMMHDPALAQRRRQRSAGTGRGGGISVSADEDDLHMELQNCPAYEQIEENDQDVLVRDRAPLLVQ